MLTWIDRLVWSCLFLVPVGFALIALALGQDANWDIRNYHWYNPYAFLTGRLGTDIGVAHLATFYNPLLDLPIYLIGSAVPAPGMGSLLGFIHGLNFVLLYGVACCCIGGFVPHWPSPYRHVVAAALALVGMFGGGHLAQVGTVFNDNLVSLPVLCGLLIIVRRSDALFASSQQLPERRDLWAIAGAGALVGLAAGLKLPTTIFAVGLCAAFLCVGGGIKRRFVLAFVFGLGVTFAFLLAEGPWMWKLWRDYANPLFPYFNIFFQSPMGVDDNYRDTRFIPNTLAELLAFPVVFSRDPLQVGELPFWDYRVLSAYLALIATAAVAFAQRMRGTLTVTLPTACRYVIAASVLTYVVWQQLFGIYRYIVALEMLAPLLVAIAVMRWPGALRVRLGILAMVLVVLTVTARRSDWTHYPWQAGPFVTASVPVVSNPDNALGVITGNDPVGWLVTFFPPQIPFIRLQGFLNDPEQPRNGLNDRVRAKIEAHQGDIFLLTPAGEMATADRVLRAYALRPDGPSCRPIPSNLGDYVRWCRVYRISQSVPGPAPE